MDQSGKATREAGAAIGEIVSVFMLHPETFAGSIAAGYTNPLAGYVAGRGGVLGEATGMTVASVFAIFEPNVLAALWQEGVAVRGAIPAAELYWDQMADFGRKHLAGADGLDRIAASGEAVMRATPGVSLPLYAGWCEMPLVDDVPGRAMQIMHVLRELRGDVHFSALALSGITPLEAHMMGHDANYTRMFGWSEPFPDGAGKEQRYAEVDERTNGRMTEIFEAALSGEQISELGRLSTGALAHLKAAVSG